MEISSGGGQGCVDFACTLPGGCVSIYQHHIQAPPPNILLSRSQDQMDPASAAAVPLRKLAKALHSRQEEEDAHRTNLPVLILLSISTTVKMPTHSPTMTVRVQRLIRLT